MYTMVRHLDHIPYNLAHYSEPWENLEVHFNEDLSIEVCHSSHYEWNDESDDECIVYEIWKDVSCTDVNVALNYSGLDGFYDVEDDLYFTDTHTNGWKGYYVSESSVSILNETGTVTLVPVVGFEDAIDEAIERNYATLSE